MCGALPCAVLSRMVALVVVGVVVYLDRVVVVTMNLIFLSLSEGQDKLYFFCWLQCALKS